MAELFYVIGASGVGKDSLLRYAREHLPAGAPLVFAHRYITRAADAGGENHVALSADEFHTRSEHGLFAIQWHSHQTCYGIGIEIEQWLAKGISVVLNGSRAYLPEAASRYPQLVPVLIRADAETLRERLLARGREDAQAIEQRLAQAAILDEATRHPRLLRINNEGELSVAGEQLLQRLLGEQPHACA